MKNKLLILLSMSIALTACSSLEEAGKIIRNERVNSTDEFLIKKRQPLTIPPDMDKIPQPNSLEQSQNVNDEEEQIKEILGAIDETSGSNKSSSGSTEKSILEQIR